MTNLKKSLLSLYAVAVVATLGYSYQIYQMQDYVPDALQDIKSSKASSYLFSNELKTDIALLKKLKMAKDENVYFDGLSDKDYYLQAIDEMKKNNVSKASLKRLNDYQAQLMDDNDTDMFLKNLAHHVSNDIVFYKNQPKQKIVCQKKVLCDIINNPKQKANALVR